MDICKLNRVTISNPHFNAGSAYKTNNYLMVGKEVRYSHDSDKKEVTVSIPGGCYYAVANGVGE